MKQNGSGVFVLLYIGGGAVVANRTREVHVFFPVENVSGLCARVGCSSVISEQIKCVLSFLDALNVHVKNSR
jgi:hypothetical protein